MRHHALALSLSLVSPLAPHAAHADPAAPGDAGSAAPSIAWRLTSEPAAATITMAQRRSFRLWMEARNTGSRTVDTGRDQVEWFLNGQASMTADMAWGNGVRELTWSALPPGARVREARDMAEHLFPSPGSYELVMRLAGRDVARLRVQVVADVGVPATR